MMNQFALLSLLLHFLLTFIIFYSVQALRIESAFKKNSTAQIQIMMIAISMGLAYLVSHFIIDIIQFTNQILVLF